MPELSLVIPYYRNPRMLARQLSTWCDEWHPSLKERVEIIVVDDASPEPAIDEVRAAPGCGVLVYRVLEDVPWHQHGARNLGAHVATGRWLLMTDMDHVIPADTLSALLEVLPSASRRTVFTFPRRDAPAGEPWRSDHWTTMELTRNDRGELKPHVNSFALRRKLFWKVGGYDEDYCGVYGTDQLFRTRLWRRGVEVALPMPIIRVSRAVIPDASTSTLERDHDRSIRKKMIARDKALRGEANVVKVLQFRWERVQ